MEQGDHQAHQWIAELRCRLSEDEARLMGTGRHSHLNLSRERVLELVVFCAACRTTYATASGRPCPGAGRGTARSQATERPDQPAP